MQEHELVPPAPRHSVDDVDGCMDVTRDAVDDLKVLSNMSEWRECFKRIVNLGEEDD